MPEFISILRWIRDIVYPKAVELETTISNLPDQITGGYSQLYIDGLKDELLETIRNISLDNIAQLKLNSNIGRVDVLGYYAKGDGGGGTFYWDSTSTETDNGGTIIQATGVTAGRWKRVISGAVNIKWFGAVGDGVTDDTIVIQNAVNYLTDCTLFFNTDIAFRITSTITIRTNIDIVMESSILKDFSTGAGIEIGVAGVYSPYNNKYVLNIIKNSRDWTNLEDVGIRIKNANNSKIDIVQAQNFSKGVVFVGDASGFAYNQIDLGLLLSNHIALELNGINGGWCNENLFNNGRFACSSATLNEGTRYGVKILSEDGTYSNFNNNVFIKPSFELFLPNSGISLPIWIVTGRKNRFMYCRNEANGNAEFARVESGEGNTFDISYEDSDSSSYITAHNSTNYFYKPTGSYRDDREKTEFALLNIGNLGHIAEKDSSDIIIPQPLYARRYNTLPLLNLPATIDTASSSIVISSSLYAVGVDVLVPESKLIKVAVTHGNISSSNRIALIPKDSSGTVITGLATEFNAYLGINQRSSLNLTWSATNWGGSYVTQVDSSSSFWIEVPENVVSISVLVTGPYSGSLYLKGISVSTFNNITSDNKGYIEKKLPYLENTLYSSNSPTTNKYRYQGERVYNKNPSAGSNIGWVCTTAGNPGTWKTFGTISA